jgi:hypothetical protein
MAPRVFFITGTSTGFGQEYVKGENVKDMFICPANMV